MVALIQEDRKDFILPRNPSQKSGAAYPVTSLQLFMLMYGFLQTWWHMPRSLALENALSGWHQISDLAGHESPLKSLLGGSRLPGVEQVMMSSTESLLGGQSISKAFLCPRA